MIFATNGVNRCVFLFLQFSQKRLSLLLFPLVFSYRSLSSYLSCFYVPASSFTNGKKICFSNIDFKYKFKGVIYNLNQRNNTKKPAFKKNCFCSLFHYFSLLIISLLCNSLFGFVRNQKQIKWILVCSTFYSGNFIVTVFIIIFFIYSKGCETRSEIKSKEPSRKYSRSLPISK